MEDNEINNMNQKLDKLIEKNELLEKENKDIKARLIKAEDNIKNLNKQQIFMRIEYKKIFHALEEKYITLLENKFKKIIQNEEKNQNKHEENEIIINEKQNNNEELLNIQNVNDLIQKSVTSKFNEIQNNIWDLFEQKKEIKIDGGEETKKNKNEDKKINQNIKKFEDILNKIFNDNEKIPENCIMDLKKLSKALIIQTKDPFTIGSDFFKKMEFNMDKKDENIKMFTKKKINTMNKLENILNEFDNILNHDDKEFMIKFRGKYGITEKNMKDKKLEELIKKNNGEEKSIIKELLVNLKYISK